MNKSKKRFNAATGLKIGAFALFVVVVALVVNWVFFGPIKLHELPFLADVQYAYNEDGFYYLQGTQLCYVDDDNSDKNIRRNINTAEIELVVSSDITLIYSTNAVRLLDADKSIEITGGRILDVKCGNKHIAVMRENTDRTVTLLIYDRASEQVDSIEFGDAYAVDFGFDLSKGELLWTIDVNTDSTQPISTLTTYDLDKRTTSGIITVVNQLVDRVEFTNNSIYIIGTSQLIRYDRLRNSESYRATCFGRVLHDCSLTQSKPLFLFVDSNTEKIRRIAIYTMTDDTVGSATTRLMTIPEEAIGVFAMAGRPIVVTSENVYIYKTNGQLDETKRFDSAIMGAIKLTDNTLLIERDGRLYTARIMN